MYRFIPIVLEVGNFATEARKLVTRIPEELLISLSHARSAMRSWQRDWLRSTAGFRTQDGPHFRYEVKKASAVLSGCHISALRYTLKSATDPQKLFEQESEQLHLSSQLKALLEPFVPRTTNGFSAEPPSG